MIMVKMSVAMVVIPQEQYMIVFNDHLKDNMEKMRKFIDTLSVSMNNSVIKFTHDIEF